MENSEQANEEQMNGEFRTNKRQNYEELDYKNYINEK